MNTLTEKPNTITKESCIDCGKESSRNMSVFQEPFWGSCFALCKNCIQERKDKGFSLKYATRTKNNKIPTRPGMVKFSSIKWDTKPI